MKLSDFNSADHNSAKQFLLECCASKEWAESMVQNRPFQSIENLLEKAATIWNNLNDEDYLEAFDGHPRIGDLSTKNEAASLSAKLSSSEQSSVENASSRVLHQLSEMNDAYYEKFGFIFIVFAIGKQPEEMLEILQTRIRNSREVEIKIGAEEQMKITKNRILNLLE